MGFNYGDVEISLNPKSLRYYNDLIWYLYSIIGYLPIVSIIIYKVYKFFFNNIRYLIIRLSIIDY